MKIHTKQISDFPDYLVTTLNNKDNIAYQEQLRVKEYSMKVDPLPGKRQVIIPFSGGLDSTASLIMAIESGAEIITANFNYGQPYFEKEVRVIEKIMKLISEKYPESNTLWTEHHIIDISWLDKVIKGKVGGDWRHIFPLRNYLILQEASKLAKKSRYQEIWFSCVKGEIPYSGGDKSIVFLTYMSDILSKLNILLSTPHIGLDKSDIINWSLSDPKRYSIIKETISCFGGDGERQCGKCQSCFNRGVAFFSNNKIKDVGFDPSKKDLSDFIEYYKYGLKRSNYYSKRRSEQILNFIYLLEKDDKHNNPKL